MQIKGNTIETSQSYAGDFWLRFVWIGRKRPRRWNVLTRVIFLRFGIVLDSGQGAWQSCALFRMGLGGDWVLAEAFAWIIYKTCSGLFEFLLQSPEIKGPVNFTH
jgi:NAD dependent epimerase/dehydratase family enzyme